MFEEPEHLDRMSAAEGAAASTGLALLVERLFAKRLIGEDVAVEIRDAMLMSVDPSVAPPSDRGLQLAYKNILVGFQFLSSDPPRLMENEPEGADELRKLIEGL